ncbi:DUF4430 domain-containing protein [Clostridium magnum]|uniref:Transcobalamin-like C-terminal domain-containing protein n=1 Tax=Clostridium magnum DSM 2767 TaxID=1121326 RepID=A0A162SYG9_9CLOT|nr:DUF4430 domain-containing protein [Clostridium magnum]KZL92031.1 hypothetical protein CLMAG_18370 [Clostridium magnum DSM 2767]SHH25268.1 protein of unknown function [Clostridium magnum DSM 2767]
MKNLKSKLISMLMVFAMVIGLVGIKVNYVFAAETANTVNVKIRVEAADHTIVHETELAVSNFDMTDYGMTTQLSKVNVMNALVMALNSNSIDCKNKNNFDAEASSYGGYYVKTIAGISAAGIGGWMYCVNNISPYNTMEQEEIKEGDSIVVYYVSDYSTVYSFFDKSEVTTTTGSITLNLKGNFYDASWNVYNKGIDGAKILVDGKEVSADGNTVVTDKDGNCVLNFDKSGTYNVSAEKDGISRSYCKAIVQLPEQAKDYTSSINTLIDGVAQNIKADGLGVLDLYKAGKQIPTTYLQTAEDNIKKNADDFTATDLESNTLSILAAGGDPTNFAGYNLVEKIYNNESMNNIMAYIYGLLALDSANFTAPQDAKWNRDKLVQAILDCKTSDGGWAYYGDFADPDVTAMTLSALAPYYNTNSDVKAAVDTAVGRLSQIQTNNGGFISYGNENSNSTEMVIIGLCDIGIDPAIDSRFVKNGKNPIDALLSFALSDNSGFGFTDASKANVLATEQGLRALVSYKFFKEGKGSVYKGFTVNEQNGTSNGQNGTSENKLIQITNLTKDTVFNLGNDAKITIQATNNSDKDQDVSLIVALYDNADQFVNYVCAEQTIKKGDSSVLTSMMKFPKEGVYKLKAFVWDSMEAMNSLSDIIEIPVK